MKAERKEQLYKRLDAMANCFMWGDRREQTKVIGAICLTLREIISELPTQFTPAPTTEPAPEPKQATEAKPTESTKPAEQGNTTPVQSTPEHNAVLETLGEELIRLADALERAEGKEKKQIQKDYNKTMKAYLAAKGKGKQ